MTLDLTLDYLVFDNLITTITLKTLDNSTVTINNVQLMPQNNENSESGISPTGMQSVVTTFCIFTTEYDGPLQTNARITANGKNYRIQATEEFCLKSARNAVCVIEAGESI
jgi:hypothetical protein